MIFDTCTITDLFELNTTYLYWNFYSLVSQIFVEELTNRKIILKIGYNNFLKNRGYSLFVQLNEEYPSLSTADKIVISIAYERNNLLQMIKCP